MKVLVVNEEDGKIAKYSPTGFYLFYVLFVASSEVTIDE